MNMMMNMMEHYERLGLTPGATAKEIKLAYHAKLKEFPAHKYPQEFKAIRSAYEALRDPKRHSQVQDFFKLQPFEEVLDPSVLQSLRQQVKTELELSLEELIRLTF